MGLFNSLWDNITEVVNTVTDVVNEVVETITKPFKTVQAVAEFFQQSTKTDLETAVKIGATASLTNNSSQKHVEEIVILLRERVKVYKNIGKNLENVAKTDINNFFNYLTEDLKKHAEVTTNINFERIEENHKKLLQDIDGAYSDSYKKSLSIDNTECREILAENKGWRKEQLAKKFLRQLTEKTFDNFETKFRNIINQQEKDISDALRKFYLTQENEFAQQTQTFKDWERDMQNQTFDKEKAQLPALEKLYVIEQVEKILAA